MQIYPVKYYFAKNFRFISEGELKSVKFHHVIDVFLFSHCEVERSETKQ